MGQTKQKEGRCIFCLGKGLTKQHLWPDWLKNVIPSVATHHTLNRLMADFSNPHIEVTPEFLNLQGHVGTKKLRVVCGLCNNGWMSTIEQEAKPIISSLINLEDTIISAEEQLILTDWIMMTTMVAEFTHLPTISIPYEHRNLLKEDTFPEGWKIWIGRYQGVEWLQRYYHIGHQLKTFPRGDPKPLGNLKGPFNTQFSTFVIGGLFMHAMSSSISEIDFKFNDQLMAKLIQINPSIKTEIKLSELEFINDAEANDIANGSLYSK